MSEGVEGKGGVWGRVRDWAEGKAERGWLPGCGSGHYSVKIIEGERDRSDVIGWIV